MLRRNISMKLGNKYFYYGLVKYINLGKRKELIVYLNSFVDTKDCHR